MFINKFANLFQFFLLFTVINEAFGYRNGLRLRGRSLLGRSGGEVKVKVTGLIFIIGDSKLPEYHFTVKEGECKNIDYESVIPYWVEVKVYGGCVKLWSRSDCDGRSFEVNDYTAKWFRILFGGYYQFYSAQVTCVDGPPAPPPPPPPPPPPMYSIKVTLIEHYWNGGDEMDLTLTHEGCVNIAEPFDTSTSRVLVQGGCAKFFDNKDCVPSAGEVDFVVNDDGSGKPYELTYNGGWAQNDKISSVYIPC